MGGGLSAAPAALERRIQSEQGRRRRALFELLHGLERTASTGVLRLQVDAVMGQPVEPPPDL